MVLASEILVNALLFVVTGAFRPLFSLKHLLAVKVSSLHFHLWMVFRIVSKYHNIPWGFECEPASGDGLLGEIVRNNKLSRLSGIEPRAAYLLWPQSKTMISCFKYSSLEQKRNVFHFVLPFWGLIQRSLACIKLIISRRRSCLFWTNKYWELKNKIAFTLHKVCKHLLTITTGTEETHALSRRKHILICCFQKFINKLLFIGRKRAVI